MSNRESQTSEINFTIALALCMLPWKHIWEGKRSQGEEANSLNKAENNCYKVDLLPF